MSSWVRSDHPYAAILAGMPYTEDSLLPMGGCCYFTRPNHEPVVLLAPDVKAYFDDLAFLTEYFPSWVKMAGMPSLLGRTR